MEEVVWTPRSPVVQVEARARPAQNLRWSRESVVSGANNLDVAVALAARRAQEDKLAHQRDINLRELEMRRRDNEKALELAAVQTACSELAAEAEAGNTRAASLEAALVAEKERRTAAEKQLQERAATGSFSAEQLTEMSEADLETSQARLEAGLDAIRREFRRRLEMDQIRLRDERAEQTLCSVCLTQEKCILLAPCNHICCCEVCGAKMQRCPLCQSAVTSRVTVFL